LKTLLHIHSIACFSDVWTIFKWVFVAAEWVQNYLQINLQTVKMWGLTGLA
jgi:hypothetical protein